MNKLKRVWLNFRLRRTIKGIEKISLLLHGLEERKRPIDQMAIDSLKTERKALARRDVRLRQKLRALP